MRTAVDVSIRRLGAADLESIARVHRAAFPHSGVTTLGPAITRHYYQWQSERSRRPVIVGAEIATGLIGFCFAAETFGGMADFVRADAVRVMLHLILRPSTLWHLRSQIAGAAAGLAHRPGPKSAAQPTDDPPALWVHAIGVEPQHQGRGVGQRLMRETEQIARQQGYTNMLLSVRKDNSHAIRAYEAAGWRCVPDREHWRGLMWKAVDA